MKVSEVLIAAKSLIDTPDKWIQGAYAADSSGCDIAPSSTNACKFCSIGALVRVGVGLYANYSVSEAYLTHAMRCDTISRFNDSHTHSEVMEAWDRAIEAAKLDEM